MFRRVLEFSVLITLGWCGPKVLATQSALGAAEANNTTIAAAPNGSASIRFDSRNFSFQVLAPNQPGRSNTLQDNALLNEIRAEIYENPGLLRRTRVTANSQRETLETCAGGWSTLKLSGAAHEESYRLCPDQRDQLALIKKLQLMIAYFDRDRRGLWGARSLSKPW